MKCCVCNGVRILALIVLTAGRLAVGGSAPETAQAREILEATGIQGGLIVHLGCGDGKLTAALRANDRYLVQGLDADAQNVRKAREYIQSKGLYGQVSVERWNGKRLPYVDNLVNLIVSETPIDVPREEILRALAPNGVAHIKQGATWRGTVKPRPKELDEWTHYQHDATGNCVGHDRAVGPPGRLQWVGSPRWSRHHDRMASMSALVSAGGRIFYIFDEGPTASVQLPQKRMLVARDAFNGTILWKRPILSWHTHMWPFKSGPAQLPRRLVAVGDRVFATLGYEAPLTALDAATGEIVRTYRDTKATEEILASGGVLFALVNKAPMPYNEYTPVNRNIGQAKSRVAREWPWDEKERSIVAIQADTGDELWRQPHRVVPLSLAANRERVFFHDGEEVVCLNRTNGKEIWRSEPVAVRDSIPTAFGPTLVVYEDVVLFSGGTRTMTALSADTGKTLWSAPHARSGHNSPEDLLVVDGLVWSGATAGGKDSGIFTGRDLHTGEIKNEFPPDVKTHWFHQRCYRSKATDKYILSSRTGVEFIDVRSNHWTPHHWVRGGCIYGIMPCNGMIYAPPHSCACYIDAKLNGFCALAPQSTTQEPPREIPDKDRLERGPAYEAIVQNPKSQVQNVEDWPTYRHDSARSGRTETPVPTNLERAWGIDLGGKLSSVVIGGDKLFVASVDTHTVHALDANSGKPVWSYTAGGRIDSPPTIYQGRALFGSADGWVYCLRASDGALVWRFRAAPDDRRMMAFEQLESVWPVHGSVLVQDGVVCCVAGRSMFLDGGLRLVRLDPITGLKISEKLLDDRDPDTGENLQVKIQRLNMPTALPDVLSSDGRFLYMRTQRFDLEGNRTEVTATDAANQEGEGKHLFSGIGFLDGSWFHRGYMIYGKAISSGAGGWFRAGRFAPAGRLLVLDDSSVYGYGRKPEYFRWSTPLEYHLFATDREPEIITLPPQKPAESSAAPQKPRRQKQPQQAKRRRAQQARAQKKKKRGTSSAAPNTRLGYHWSRETPLHVRAMVLSDPPSPRRGTADKTLFVAGPPDLIDEEQVFANPNDAALRARLEEQTAAFEGKKGALLLAVSAKNGEPMAEYPLKSPPVWDGMAAANGRLYLATQDGQVLCFAGRSGE